MPTHIFSIYLRAAIFRSPKLFLSLLRAFPCKIFLQGPTYEILSSAGHFSLREKDEMPWIQQTHIN